MTKKKRPGIAARIWKGALKWLGLLVLVSVLQVLSFKFIDPPGTVNMVYEWISHKIWNTRYVSTTYTWKDMKDISPLLQKAVMASEDQRFLEHHGFDFQEIKIVLKDMVEKHRFRGASTITMQAARSLFLPSSRHPARKLAEAWYTLLMELTWDKKRILEVYLNTVDWGTGVAGAEAGARKYFLTGADRLNRHQAALMAAILPSPHKWSVKHPSAHVLSRQRWILKYMENMTLPD